MDAGQVRATFEEALRLASGFEGRGLAGIREEVAVEEFGRIAERIRRGYEPDATRDWFRAAGRPVLEAMVRTGLLAERFRRARRFLYTTPTARRLIAGRPGAQWDRVLTDASLQTKARAPHPPDEEQR